VVEIVEEATLTSFDCPGFAILFGFTKVLSLLSLINGLQSPNLRLKGLTIVDACISAPNDPLHVKLDEEHQVCTRISNTRLFCDTSTN
jgi:hypothetical protein